MDPLSQAVLGANFSQIPNGKKMWIVTTCLGFAAGLAADLDVLIYSSSDPLLSLEYHRQFTHSLIFIPVGALIVTVFSRLITRQYLSWSKNYLACFFGYASHALLDSCTSYGTQLFWPFSDERVAWNIISIVDPLFTIPVLIFIIIAAFKGSKLFSCIGLLWGILYLSIGIIQKERALVAGLNIANTRSHFAHKLSVKPAFGNLLIWKSIYEHNNFYFVDAIRLGTDIQYCIGEKIEKFNLSRHVPNLDKDSQQAIDIKKFHWFSDGYLAFNEKSKLILDVRYSMVPNTIDPLWGIIINAKAERTEHVKWWESKKPTESQQNKFFQLFRGKNCVKGITIKKNSINTKL